MVLERRQLENSMKTKKILLIMLVVGLSRCHVNADGLTNNPTNPIKKIGDYSMMRGTNGHYIFVNPGEFWNGIWKEDINGWRVQLRVRPEIYSRFQEGVGYTLSTNLLMSVQWGSVVKNSGSGYFMTPNGKFARFELLDAKGNVVPPNPNAGTNLLERTLNEGDNPKLIYETNLPAWVAPLSGTLVSNFPKTISTDVYPYFEYSMDAGKIGRQIMGKTGSLTNRPPFYIGYLKLDYIYSVTNEGDYTLTVQPVLYKRYNHTNDAILDRVDLPSVTTKVHLVPNVKLNSTRQP